MRADRPRLTMAGGGQRVATLVLAGLGVIAVISGLLIAGGPLRARMERHDNVRLNDLREISSLIDCLAANTGVLPRTVAPTENCVMTPRMTDPFTGAPYRIEPGGDAAHYRVCAKLELPPDPGESANMWQKRDGDCLVFELPRRVADDPAGAATEPGLKAAPPAPAVPPAPIAPAPVPASPMGAPVPDRT